MYTAYLDNNSYRVEFEKNSIQKGHLNGEPFDLDFIKDNNTGFHLIKGNNSYQINIVSVNYDTKEVVLKINGAIHNITLKDEIDELLKNMGLSNAAKKTDKEVKAPMPGLVTKILIHDGDTVKKGDILLVLEAMKMENNIKSSTEGIVKKIHCISGKAVEKNEILLVFE